MKRLKKELSLMLAAALIFSSVGISLSTTNFETELSKAASVSSSAAASTAVTFYVPEVIYLTPNLSTTSSFQYFVDCDTNGTKSTDRAKTTGVVYFNCPTAAGTNVAISCSGGSVSSWSITTQNATTFNGTINTGSVTTAQSQGQESYLVWTATYYVNGEAKTVTAQTCVYAPYCQPVGAAARFNNTYLTDNFAQAVSWISGVHGYSVASRGGNYNPKTASNSLYSLGASVTAPSAGSHTGVSAWLTGYANGSIGYQSNDAADDGTLYSNSPHGLLTVDTSRYGNMNQIPNFTTGFLVSDDENNSSCTSYLVDFTDRGGHDGNGFNGDNNNVWNERDDRPGTIIDGTTAAPWTIRQENIRYNGTWNRAISGTGSQELRAKGYLLCQDGNDEAAVSTCTYLTLTKVDKSALRAAVRQYINYGLQAADYPSGTWATYANELAYANQRLTNPKYSADVTTTALVNAYNALVKNTYTATINHTSADGYISASEPLTFNSGDTVSFSPNSYTGYTISSAAGSTTSISPQTWYNRRANITVTYTYTPNTNTVYKVNHYKVNVAQNNWDFAEQDTLYGTTNTSVTAPHKDYPGFYASSEGGSYDTGVIAPDGSLVITQYYRRYFYNITFNANGGTGGAPATSMIYGGTLTAPSPGTKTGYTFTGWSPSVPATVGVGDATYTAQWTANTYTVAYDGNGFTGGSTAGSSHTYDTAKNLTGNGFSRTGYTFASWNTAANGSGTAYSDGQSVSNLTAAQGGTVTLYAQWTINQYTINFNSNGGSAVSPITQNYNSSVNAPSAPALTGYTFYAWYSDAGLMNQVSWPYTLGASNVIFYAKWTPNTYTVSYDGNGYTGGSTASSSHTYNSAKNLTGNGYSKTGYTFTGWATSAGGAVVYADGQSVTNLTAANGVTITLYAKWTPNNYTVVYDGNGSTGGSTSGSSHIYDSAKALTSNGFTKTGYTFAGWATSAGGAVAYSDGQSVTNLTAANGATVTLYAKWTPNSYTVVYDGNGSTGGSTSGSSHTYDSAKALTSNGFIKTGYTFAGWATSAVGAVAYADGQSVTNLTAVNGATVILYAKWAVNTYTVAYNGNGSTGGSTANSSHTYDSARALTSNSFTKTGYTFAGWATSAGGDVVYSDGQSVTNLTATNGATVNLYAKWTANNYTVAYDGNGNTGGSTSSSSHTYDTAKVLTGNGFSKTGYTFAGWNTAANGSGTSYTNGQSVSNLTAAQGATVTLYARWTANSYSISYNGNGYTSGSTSDSAHTYDLSANLTANGFEKTGYSFLGWSTNAGATSADYTDRQSVSNLTSTPNDIVTFYAVWSINHYTITFNANGGLGGTSGSMTYNADLNAPAVTKTGYTFSVWSPSVPAKVPASNTTYTAQWTANTYTVTYNGNGYTGGATAGSSHTYDAAKNLTGNGFSKTGYTFAGWNTAANGSGTSYTDGQSVSNLSAVQGAAVTLYAKWTANTYTVAYDGNGYTGGSMSSSSHTYDTAKNLTGNGFSKTGYTFTGWAASAAGSAVYTDTESVSNLSAANGATVTLYAKWSANSYTVTFNAQQGTVSTESKEVTYDSSYGPLPTPEREGYSFNGWFTQSSGGTQVTSSSSVAITSPQTIYAQWTMIPVSFTELNTLVDTFDSAIISSIPVLSGDGTAMGSVYGYGNATQRQAVSDAYVSATALQALAPIPNTAANRSMLADARDELGGAMETLLSNPLDAVYTYVDEEINDSGTINLNRYTKASIDELQAAVNNVVTGKHASEQATVNAYAAAIYNQREGSSALAAYQDNKGPKINVLETTKTMEDSGITIPGFNPDNYGDVSYVYPGKGYQTYYCYTNSENPAILVNIQDVADSNSRLSYPANLNVTRKSGTVNSGFMSLSYDSDAHRAGLSQGTRLVSSPYSGYTVGMNYSELGSDYYRQAGYLVLKPQFTQSYNSKQFAVYTISGVDDASEQGNLADISTLAGGTQAYKDGKPITTTNTTWTPTNTITVFVEYRNTMSNVSGTYYEDGRSANSFKAYNNLGADNTWVTKDYFYRVAAGATNDEIIKRNDAVYPSNDPTFGQKNLGCFYYVLDSSRDADVINTYNENGAVAATNQLKQDIAADAGGVYSSNTVYWVNTAWSIGHVIKSPSRLVFVHLADRWGNIYNNIIKVNNVDPTVPVITDVTAGSASLNESGGSGVSLVRVYKYAYEGSPSFVVPCWSDKLITELSMINEPDNTLDIQLDISETNCFTLYTKDKAGNEVTKTVYTDSGGNLSITVNDPENMQQQQRSMARSMAAANTGAKVYTFLLNDSITVNLNSPEPVTYDITFDAGDKGFIGSDTVQTVTLHEGDAITAPSVTSKDGWCFAGWSPEVPATASESATYSAQYIKTGLHVTKLETGLKVNIQGWNADYKYQIWSYQKVTSDIFLDENADVPASQWILSKAYTAGSSSEAIREPDGSISFIINDFTSPDSNYTVAVRIMNAGGSFAGELRDSFTPSEIREVKITKVLVDGDYYSNSVTKEAASGASVLIKVVGNGVAGTAYTATVLNPETSLAVSNTNEFVWDISSLAAGQYTVSVSASNGTTKDTKLLKFNLYSADSSIHYGNIDSMSLVKGSGKLNITPDYSNGSFRYQIREPGRLPIFISDAYTGTGTIEHTMPLFGIYQVLGYVNRTDTDSDGGSFDDGIVKTIAFNRSSTKPSTMALNANVNLNNPVPKNSAVHFAAVASISGIASTPVQYSYWRYDANGFALVKDWSSDPTLDWTPARVGVYTIEVRAKGIDAGSYEVNKSVTVSVTDTVEHIAQGVSISINAAELNANAKARIPVTVKATATSTSGEDLLYKFNVFDPYLGTCTLQSYSVNQNCLWIPRKPGNYTISVLVKNKVSFGGYDAMQSFDITVK